MVGFLAASFRLFCGENVSKNAELGFRALLVLAMTGTENVKTSSTTFFVNRNRGDQASINSNDQNVKKFSGESRHGT
jgi:hypothetical protein